MELKLAVFTVQTYDLTPEQVAPLLAELGYDGVEWRVTTLPETTPADRTYWNGNVCTFEIGRIAAEAPRLRALSDAHGLAVPSLGTHLDCRDIDRVEACLAAAAAIGVPRLRVGLPRWDTTVPHGPALADAVRLWEPLVELGRRHGVRLLAELHHGSLIPSAGAARAFLGHWPARDVGAIWDPGNMVFEGWEHPAVSLGLLGEYLAHVHVKNARWRPAGEDLGARRWSAEMCRLREGQVFWPRVLGSLAQLGYAGWFATEDFGSGETREKLADNAAALREWAAAVD